MHPSRRTAANLNHSFFGGDWVIAVVIRRMIDFAYYTETIKAQTALLSQREKVALCLICCLRLEPLYRRFTVTECWGDNEVLMKCRDSGFGWLDGVDVDASKLQQEMEPHIPHTDDFGSILGSFALNAGLAHLDLLAQLQTNDNEPLTDALQVCYDTVDFAVQTTIDPSCKSSIPSADIDSHPMMLLEVQNQIELIRSISGNKNLRSFVEGQSYESELARFISNALDTQD